MTRCRRCSGRRAKISAQAARGSRPLLVGPGSRVRRRARGGLLGPQGEDLGEGAARVLAVAGGDEIAVELARAFAIAQQIVNEQPGLGIILEDLAMNEV